MYDDFKISWTLRKVYRRSLQKPFSSHSPDFQYQSIWPLTGPLIIEHVLLLLKPFPWICSLGCCVKCEKDKIFSCLHATWFPLTSLQLLFEQKQPHRCCQHHASLWVWCSGRVFLTIAVTKYYKLWPKSSTLVSWDYKIFFVFLF